MAIRQIERLIRCLLSRGAIEKGAHTRQPQSSVDHRLDDTHVVPHLECPGGDADRPAIRQRFCESIDDSAGNPMACKLGRHRQSDGACAYDKNLRYGVSHFTNVAAGPLFMVVNLWQS